ncbi:Activator of Hsp90 ATPase homolog 1-like protein [Mucilaginibacter mallensis]|uniref:Activator of Hsp90 ATPase homolog 1-like protein n=1 Tax=Mucilaginibacter mallensis TaxID=652787 RepID=A0A1H1U1Y7_MUCMA|nr:SRPBCC domain-containing protein [Mucilaginibacter mallensis]SDS66403.1 Activator of Hsp90 ATPase homolog 1-like protein [Mucilaginibacter mallensis]
MKTHNFTTTLLVDQSPKEVFNAVNQPQNWWSGEIEGSPAKLNDEFTYRYKEIHFSKQRVVEMIPDQKVVWLVTDSIINYTEDINEWTGTKISFEITKKDGKTELRFSHIGLVPEIECFDACSGAWTQLVRQGLFSLITTGKGEVILLG